MASAAAMASSMSPCSSDLPALLGMVRPDAGEAIGHQLDAHGELVAPRASPTSLLALLHARQDAELVLHVVADLVRDHIGIGEVAAGPEAALHLLEEREVDVDGLVERAVERPHGRLRARRSRSGSRREQHELGRLVLAVDLLRQHRASTRPRCCRGSRRRSGPSRPAARPGGPAAAARSREPPPVIISAPPIRMRGSMPSAQPTRPRITMVPMPRPPRRRACPCRGGLPHWRRFENLPSA